MHSIECYPAHTHIDDEKQADKIDRFERENDGEEMDRVIDVWSHEDSDESKSNESENEEQNKENVPTKSTTASAKRNQFR